MANKSNVKERSTFNKLCSILIDIFVIPVIIIAFICAIIMSSAKANNKVPSIMGNSIVEVLTDSMDKGTKESYKVGDILIIDQTINPDNLKVGDCIAFYAPKQSKFTTDGTENGQSLIIFHRIVRIIYAKEVNNGVESENVKRHFVCRGDNNIELSLANGTLIPTQAKQEDKPRSEWGGDYDEYGKLTTNGGYVVKLLDDNEVATDENHVQSVQSTLQYVTDEYVVGSLKSRASGFLSSLVKFCCSSVGIILLVIIPASIMFVIILINIIQESKIAKKERESDQLVFAKNMSILGAMPNSEQNKENLNTETAKENKETSDQKQAVSDQKQADANPSNVVDDKAKNIDNKNKEEIKKELPQKAEQKVKKEIPVKTAKKSVPAKKPVVPKVESSKQPAKPKSKTPAVPKTANKVPTKPTVPKTTKTGESKTAVKPPKAPAKVPPKKN